MYRPIIRDFAHSGGGFGKSFLYKWTLNLVARDDVKSSQRAVVVASTDHALQSSTLHSNFAADHK